MEPSLNSWTTIFLIAAGQGLFLVTILLFANLRRRNFNWPIIVIVSFFSLTLVHYVLYWTGFIKVFPHLRFIPELGFYLSGPLLLLYLRRVLYQRKAGVKFIFHLIPAFWLFGLVVYFWASGSFPFVISEHPVFGRLVRLPIWPWAIVLHMLAYNMLMLILITRYQEKGEDELASIRIRWSKAINLFYSAFIIAFASYYFLVGFDFFQREWDYMISVVMSLSIYGIGYMAFTQPRIFNGIFLHQVFVPKKYKSSQLTDSLSEELFAKLKLFFDTKQPFLNPELRQAHVCEELGCTTHQISQLINEKTGSNINTYIKNYRLEYAVNLINENPGIDMKTVFYQSGFNNKTSFNTAFKQKFSCTPTAYKAKLLDETE